jgi:hypothetical protein
MKSINDLYETTPSHKQDIQFIELSVGDPDRLSDIGSLRITIQDQVTSHKTLFDGVVFIDEKLRAVEPSIEELSKSVMSALEAAKD